MLAPRSSKERPADRSWNRERSPDQKTQGGNKITLAQSVDVESKEIVPNEIDDGWGLNVCSARLI